MFSRKTYLDAILEKEKNIKGGRMREDSKLREMKQYASYVHSILHIKGILTSEEKDVLDENCARIYGRMMWDDVGSARFLEDEDLAELIYDANTLSIDGKSYSRQEVLEALNKKGGKKK